MAKNETGGGATRRTKREEGESTQEQVHPELRPEYKEKLIKITKGKYHKFKIPTLLALFFLLSVQ